MAHPFRNPRTRTFALVASAAVLTTASLSGPFTERSEAGGHIDAPSQLKDSPTDLTDVYAFTSPDDEDMVTLIANVRPFQLPGTPDKALADYPFANGAHYELHTDADGDGTPDTTYRWTFEEDDRRPFGTGPKVGPLPVNSLDDSSLRVRQTYTLERVTREGGSERTEKLVDGIAAPTNVGRPLMPDYPKLREQAVEELPGGGRTLAGQSAESFKANTQVFGLYTAGTAGPVPQWGPDATPLAALNVNSLIVQVPKKQVALRHDVARNPVVGVWASVSRPGADLGRSLSAQAPSYRQVSRQGTPHVAFALFGTTVGLYRPGGPEDRLQQRRPVDDPGAKEFQAAALDPRPPHRMERAHPGSYKAPKAPREDIQALLMKGIGKGNGSDFGFDLNTHALNQDADPGRFALAEELRLNLTTPVSADPKAEGVVAGDKQGFPNGRRPNDNIDNALIRMLAGEPARGDGSKLVPKPVADLQPKDAQRTFPYLNPPHGL